MRLSQRLAVLAVAVIAIACTSASRAGLPGPVTPRWTWVGATRDPAFPRPTAILVMQMTDDDGDGRIDGADMPDVILMHQSTFGASPAAVITILDGATGAEHLTIRDIPIGAGQPAAADLDGDTVAEIIVGNELVIRAFRYDGSLIWERPWPRPPHGAPPPLPPENFALGVADLNQDGVPEIYSRTRVWHPDLTSSFGGTVLSWDGALSWTVVRLQSVDAQGPGNAADLDLSRAGLELLVGNTLFDASGGVIWRRTDLSHGNTAIGDLTGDGLPEIVLHEEMGLYVLDRAGNTLDGPLMRPWGSPVPLICDLNGDDTSEVVVNGDNSRSLVAYRWAASRLQQVWSVPLVLPSSTASAGDLDGDGAAEVVYLG